MCKSGRKKSLFRFLPRPGTEPPPRNPSTLDTISRFVGQTILRIEKDSLSALGLFFLGGNEATLALSAYYPHYFHLRGKKGEPVFFEQPPKTDLPALRAGGMDLHGLVRHYAMVTEFQWQFIERNDFARSITVFDLEGMRMMDFVGEVIDYVKMCSQFTGQHYPERAGHVIVVNVPRW